MSSQDNIIKRITEEAQKEADAAIAESSAKAKELLAASSAETDAEIERIEHGAEAKAQELRRRRLAVAEMEARKDVLAQKQAILDEAFAGALSKLSALPDSDIAALLTPVVAKEAEGTERLVVPLKNRALYEKSLLKRLNEALEKAGKPGKLSLCEKNGNFAGGLVLASDVLEKNISFEALLRGVREDSEKAISELLFGEA